MCSHSPPVLIVWAPWTMVTLSFTWKRFTSSSTLGAMKNGLPNRNEGANPTPVSAGMLDAVATRGRDSRDSVMWNSFNFVAVSEVNRLALSRLIFDGPSVPLAVVP